MIRYTDSEVAVFHPVCEGALNDALSALGLSGTYQVVHHRRTGTLEMDYAIENEITKKYLCVVEVKRTPADVNSVRYQFQAMSYVQNNTGMTEKPFYILTNLEYAYAFRYDAKRHRGFQQMLKPGLTAISDFTVDDEIAVRDKLAKYFEQWIRNFVADIFDYLLTLQNFASHMEPLKDHPEEWKSHLAVLLYEYIRGSFSYIGRTGLRDVRVFGGDISKICAEASKVNFKGIYGCVPADYAPGVTVPNAELTELFDLGQQNVTGDTIAGVLYTIVSAGHEHDGEVATDLELGRLLAVLAKAEKAEITPKDMICDPAAGSGNLICSAAEIMSLHPSQIIANDVNPRLSELLSLRLGLQYAGSIAKTNSPRIEQEDILDLTKDFFRDVSVVIMNPPFLAGIHSKAVKGLFTSRIQALKGTRAKTALGQIPLEAMFLELVTELVVPGTVIACVYPSNFLTARGREAVAVRELLLSGFGLKTIFMYPGNGIFDAVTKSTCVLVGRAKQPSQNVRVISSYAKVPDIDIHQFSTAITKPLRKTFAPVMSGVEGRLLPSADLARDLSDGWRKLSREMEEAVQFVRNTFALSPDFVQLGQLRIQMKRGTVGNGGGSGLLLMDPDSALYGKYLPAGLEVMPALRNAKYDAFLVGDGDTRFFDERINSKALVTDIIEDYMDTLADKRRQRRNAKTFAQWEDIVHRESGKSFPAHSVLVPRAIRTKGKAFYATKDLYVSTNFLVCHFNSPGDAVLASTWMTTLFYQIMCEISSKNEEGMRKMESMDIRETYIPKFSNVSAHTLADLQGIMGTISFACLHDPQIREVDEIWARELFGTDAEDKLNTAKEILSNAANVRDPRF